MSEIRNQSIANAAISFVGVALGYLYTGLLAPYVFTPEQIGLTSALMAVALIASHVAKLGGPHMTIRFFPFYKETREDRLSFLNFLLILTCIGSVIFVVLYLLLQPWIIDIFSQKSPLFAEYNRLAIMLVLFMTFFELYLAYSRSVLRTIVPAILKEILWRVLVILMLVAYYYKLIDFETFVWLYAAGYALPMVIMIAYLYYQDEIPVGRNLDLKGRHGELWKYGRYVLIGTLSTITISEVDKLMIAKIVGLEATGIYQIAAFFSQLILVPSRAIVTVAAPLVAGFLMNEEIDKVERIYKKSSINQLLAGLFLFTGIYINLHNIFRILPPEYAAGEYVIIFLSISKLFDMATGINGEIILNSKYYRFDLYFNLALLAMILLANYLLIPIYGITGAAIASAVVILLYNSVKSWFLWSVYRIQPFSIKTLLLVLMTLLVIGINHFLPVVDNLIGDIFYRSAIMTILFGILAWVLKISPDVNDTVSKVLARVRR